MARPQKDINQDVVEDMASLHCTNEEIAACLDCSADTLERRYAGVLKRGREKGKESLRRLQYKRAQAGSDTMLIWLGKQLLGQKDKAEVEHVVSEEFASELQEARKRAALSQTAH